MPEKRQEPAPSEIGPDALAGDVHEAIRSLGWVVPEYEDDVLRAEAELSAGAISLPGSLGNADAVFEGKASRGAVNVNLAGLGTDTQVEEDLARAARKGGKITQEVEDRMRRDRQAAEDTLEQEEPES